MTETRTAHTLEPPQLLSERGFPYEEIVLGKDVTTRSLRAVTGAGTVPQVYVGGKHIGTADDLEAYLKTQPSPAAA